MIDNRVAESQAGFVVTASPAAAAMIAPLVAATALIGTTKDRLVSGYHTPRIRDGSGWGLLQAVNYFSPEEENKNLSFEIILPKWNPFAPDAVD